jgi:hypothetical protein
MPPEIIEDKDDLYRRVHFMTIKDNGDVSSAAFQNQKGTDEMSVDLGRLTTPQATTLGDPSYGVASLKAGLARSLGQDVFHHPEGGNCAHSTVKGHKPPPIRKQLRDGSKLVLSPGPSAP